MLNWSCKYFYRRNNERGKTIGYELNFEPLGHYHEMHLSYQVIEIVGINFDITTSCGY